MKDALYGQGVIGAWAGPRDPGTASIKLMHYQGDLLGQGPLWGYVEGGMGQVSFAIAQAARDLGAQLATGVPVAEILPGEGVLEGGELIRAATVVSNADPRRTLGLVDPAAARRLPGPDRRLAGPLAGGEAERRPAPAAQLPGRVGVPGPPVIDVTRGLDAAQEAFADTERGVPTIGFAELYFQTAYDPSVAPAGQHLISVFAQYAPYTLAEGTWDSRRDEIGRQVLDAIAEFAPDLDDCVAEVEVLGPRTSSGASASPAATSSRARPCPTRCGSTASPPAPPSPASTCGAATHPAGSVIALNGRNAAMAVSRTPQRRGVGLGRRSIDPTARFAGRGLALLGAGGQALDQEPLGGEEQDDDREGQDHRAGHEGGLGDLDRPGELGQAQRHRPVLAVLDQEQQGEQELVPGDHEHEQAGGHDRRHGQGQRDLADDGQAAGPVQGGRLLQALGHRLEVVAQHVDGDRTIWEA